MSGTIAGDRGERDAADHRRPAGLRPQARLRRRSRRERSRRGSPARRRAPPRSRGRRGLYLGTSSYEVVDHLQAPVVIRAGKGGPRVTARWTIAAKCRRGPREQFVNLTPLTRVRADGSFGRSERFARPLRDALVRYRARFAGRFAGEGASGTLRLRARVFNRSGKRLRTRCDSGTRTWNVDARRHGRAAPALAPAPTLHHADRGAASSRSSARGRCA